MLWTFVVFDCITSWIRNYLLLLFKLICLCWAKMLIKVSIRFLLLTHYAMWKLLTHLIIVYCVWILKRSHGRWRQWFYKAFGILSWCRSCVWFDAGVASVHSLWLQFTVHSTSIDESKQRICSWWRSLGCVFAFHTFSTFWSLRPFFFVTILLLWHRLLPCLSNFIFVFDIEVKQLLFIFLYDLIHMLSILQFVIEYILKTK